jgi:cytochrome c-type biogenesis protein CcmH
MIYAKAAQGRPMPIAIQKLPIKAFTGQVVLSDMNSVMSEKLLSQHDQALIVVRISTTGSAMKQPDDLQVVSEVVNIADNPSVTLNLN